MPSKLNTAIAVAGIDIGKNSFHVIGLDKRGAIVLRQKWSRGQVEARLSVGFFYSRKISAGQFGTLDVDGDRCRHEADPVVVCRWSR